MGNGSNLCSLCLCSIWDKNFEEIDDTVKEISDIIFANKNVCLVKGHPICYTCSGKIKDNFNFKCMCIYTEDFLAPYSSSDGITQLNLKEAHMKKFGGKITDIVNNDSVCRLCLQRTKGNIGSFLDGTELDMIQKCIPEITIQRTLHPVACYPCVRSLHNYYAFLSDCLNAQDRKNRYHDSVFYDAKANDKNEPFKMKFDGEDKSDLKLSIIGKGNYKEEKHFGGLRNGVDSNFGNFQQFHQSSSPYSTVKLERLPKKEDAQPPHPSIPFPTYDARLNQPHTAPNDDYYKSSILYDLDLHMIRQAELDFKATRTDGSDTNSAGRGAQKKRRTPAKTKTHTCEHCGYQTAYLNALKSHRLNHMEAADIDMYTCGKCEYKTKYRNALKSHELNHKLPSEISMRKCEECSYETKHRTALVLHMLKHKKPEEIQMYRCDSCDFQTKFKHALKPHKLKHKGGT